MNLEAAVVANCLGNLLSALIILLAYLLFQLWRDYIAIICSSFLLSQALARVKRSTSQALKAARRPSSPPLLHQLAGFAAEEARHGRLSSVPPLVLLASLLLFLLLDDISSVGVILAGLAVYGIVAAALLWLFDKRLLGYEAVVSDESLVAMAVLLLLMLSVSFVVTVILVRSVVDVVGLCVLLPDAMRSIVASEDTATASALDGLVSRSVCSYLVLVLALWGIWGSGRGCSGLFLLWVLERPCDAMDHVWQPRRCLPHR